MLYVPDFPCEWALSRWAGRPQGLSIDPLGVECFVAVPEAKRGLFGRRRAARPVVAPYLHVLVHTDLPGDRIRSWAAMQVARVGVLALEPDAAGDRLNRLTDDEAGRLAGTPWTPGSVELDGREHEASVFVADANRWALYGDLGDHRLVLIGRDLAVADARLRTASADESRRITADALRV